MSASAMAAVLLQIRKLWSHGKHSRRRIEQLESYVTELVELLECILECDFE